MPEQGAPTADTPVGRIAGAVGKGAAEGFGNTPLTSTILSPAAQTKLDDIQRAGGWKGTAAQLASTIGTDIGTAGSIIARGLGAAMKGAQAGVAQTGEEAGTPQLGRDIAGMAEAFPTGDTGGGLRAGSSEIGGNLKGAREASKAAREQIPTMTIRPDAAPDAAATPSAGPGPIRNASGGGVAIDGPPGEPVTATPGVAAGWRPLGKDEPRSVGMTIATDPATGIEYVQDSSAGAQITTAHVPNLTPAQRATAERSQMLQTHLDRAGPSRIDPSVYVPGVRPTEAAVDPYGMNADGNTNALAEKTLRATSPEFASRLDAQNTENNNIRKDAFMQHAQDPNAIDTQEQVRQESFNDNQAAAIAGSSPVDPADARAVVEGIDDTLRGPAGKQDSVANELRKVRAKFFRDPSASDPEGTTEWDRLETDPAMLNGVRRHLNDRLSSVGQKDSDARLASSQLLNVRNGVDDLIATTAPGYRTLTEQFHADSIPIDQMRELQKYLSGPSKITDGQGMLQHGKVQAMLEKIVNDRAKPGVNNAKSLTDDQMDMLFRLRNDLARDNHRDYIARTKGSDTTQQLTARQRLMGVIREHGPEAIAHTVVGHVAPGIGNAVYATTVKPYIKARKEAQAAAQVKAAQTALGNKLLRSHPQWEGTPY